jgi:signal peptidase I
MAPARWHGTHFILIGKAKKLYAASICNLKFHGAISDLTRANRFLHLFPSLLSLLMPGLGQVFADQRKTGAAIYVSSLFLYGIFWAGIYRTFQGLLIWLAAVSAVYGFNMAHAFYAGKKVNRSFNGSYLRATVYLTAAGLHLALAMVILFHLSLPVKIYHIPTSSMSPTLKVGDFFLIDRYSYKNKQPQKGDVIVFTSPADPMIDLIKRVAALPGDTVKKRRGFILVNGEHLPSQSVKLQTGFDRFGAARSDYYFEPQIVPLNHIFVLGDNLKNSLDSRFFKSIDRASTKVLCRRIYDPESLKIDYPAIPPQSFPAAPM